MEPVSTTIALIKLAGLITSALGFGYVAKKGVDAYEKGKEIEAKKITAQSKIDQDKINSANKIAEDAKAEATEIKKKYEEKEQEYEKTKREAEEARNNSLNPNLTEEERRSWASKYHQLESKLQTIDKEKLDLSNLLKQKEKEIQDSIKIISSAGTGSSSNNHWIKELVTLENALILGGCYMLYKLTKDDK